MIKFENLEVIGWKNAIRAARNPMNSWHRTDSIFDKGNLIRMGAADLKLLNKMVNSNNRHGDFMNMLTVYVDITAPIYWWKDFDNAYNNLNGVSTVGCTLSHMIHEKKFHIDDFSHERLSDLSKNILHNTVDALNKYRDCYLKDYDKENWWQIKQLLPTTYNQRRTVVLNYGALRKIYNGQHTHVVAEWGAFCSWIKDLPYSELITSVVKE